MAKKRANGEGSLRKRKDGRWEGRYTAGHDPETGKAIYKNVLGRTKTETAEKLKAAIGASMEVDDTKKPDDTKRENYTVSEWLEVWLEDWARMSLRPSTYQTYKGFMNNHIGPRIGKTPLEKLTSLEIQRLYKELLENGRVQSKESRSKPKGLAPKTVRNLHQMFSSALDAAMAQRLILSNPAKVCTLPKVERQEMKTLTPDQLAAFFQEAKRSGVYELYYLDLATGLCRGELRGLKRSIVRQNGIVGEAPLKTKNAYRTLPLSEDAVEVLKEQKKKAGDSPYVFPSPAGGPMSPDSVLHRLQRVLKRAGLPRIRFHDLRHTFATLALQNGVDVKTVSGMLGHYSAGFTLDTYAHVTTSAQIQAANTMGSVLATAER